MFQAVKALLLTLVMLSKAYKNQTIIDGGNCFTRVQSRYSQNLGYTACRDPLGTAAGTPPYSPCGVSSAVSGSVSVKVVPCPSSLATVTWPPWAATISCTM
jgi:hypothetical protein